MAYFLQALPREIILEIFKLLIPSKEEIPVHYKPQKGSPYRQAYILMVLNKYFSTLAIQIFYGMNTFHFYSNPENDLPLFLQDLREEALTTIRRVKITGRARVNWTYSLGFLMNC